MLSPGAVLGVFGGGQLGRMFCQAAERLGYRTHVYCPDEGSPAFEVCTEFTRAPYEDAGALARFGSVVDVVTFEFENIPVEVLKHLPASVPVRPSGNVLRVCQHRGREKAFLSANGFPIAPYVEISLESDFEKLKTFSFPAVLKTAGFGYDGKGQTKVASVAEARAAWEKSGRKPMVLEAWIVFTAEASVIVARDIFGKTQHWGLFENRHSHHILDLTLWPAKMPVAVEEKATALAIQIATKLDVIGLIAVEFFIDSAGRVLVNELAPRPHNSGHITMNASSTSQFEQHVRAITGIGLGSPACTRPGAMANLLGDLWKNGEPVWKQIPSRDDCFLHLYGKKEARAGRKMGHLNVLGDSSQAAAERATALRNQITV